jgi:hypothetical protein
MFGLPDGIRKRYLRFVLQNRFYFAYKSKKHLEVFNISLRKYRWAGINDFLFLHSPPPGNITKPVFVRPGPGPDFPLSVYTIFFIQPSPLRKYPHPLQKYPYPLQNI